MAKLTPAETVDRLRKQAWGGTVEPEHGMMLAAADVIAALMDRVNNAEIEIQRLKTLLKEAKSHQR